MKKILLLVLLCVSCFAVENEIDLEEIKQNQEKQFFYIEVMTLLLGCSTGLQTVQLMIHAKNQKSLI